jgi:hypothetical protein
MLDDTTKILLGPLLALIPILIWELAIKPSRSRRNLALLLMAEVELNLEEIAYYFAAREDDPTTHLANLLLPRGSFLASQVLLGELPPAEVRALIRFYAIVAKLEGAHLSLAATLARSDRTSAPEEMNGLLKPTEAALRTIDALLVDAWDSGVDVRESLDELVRTGWMDAPPPADDADMIRAAARSRHAARLKP